MIKAAKDLLEERRQRGDGVTTETTFEVGFGEDLSGVFDKNSQVDLVVAGESIRYLNLEAYMGMC